jgi:hypothetical protein
MLHALLISPLVTIITKKYKIIPVTGHGGPQGCEMLRLQHFLDNRFTTTQIHIQSLNLRCFIMTGAEREVIIVIK